MILNKVKYGAVLAAILMVVRVFLPDIDIPAGFEEAIMVVIVFTAQFFIRETEATRAHLKVK